MDVATGTGYHSILLKQNKINVISLDGSREMLNKAEENAIQKGLSLETIHADWEKIPKSFNNSFDALICLGNSFTHLLDIKSQTAVLKNFFDLLKKGGNLIIDIRNYDLVTSQTYVHKNKFYYTGKEFEVKPVDISSDILKFKYEHVNNLSFQLTMQPLSLSKFIKLLESNGFAISAIYGDFSLVEEITIEEFVCLLAHKSI